MNDLPETFLAVVRQRIESRYRRILFVHRELAKIDKDCQSWAAKKAVSKNGGNSPKTVPGGSFEDFVFNRIDFSVYKKIDAEEFRLLFDEGLADYEEAFYQKNFAMDSAAVRRIIAGAYIKAGLFYLCKTAGPLLLSIMRTLHTSLDFAPLLVAGETADPSQFPKTMELLDGLVIRHQDGMETNLFIQPGTQPGGPPILRGTFYPLGKPCTVTLIS
jgi:hypothetical protein